METEIKSKEKIINNDTPEIGLCQTPILRNAIYLPFIHIVGLYAFWMLITGQFMWQTFVFSTIVGYWGGFGVTAGAHRLWSHQCYKAKTPLKILLLIGQTLSGQDSLLYWSMDHRVHHKHTETDADPYSAARGFWFSHIGWTLQKKTDALLAKLKTVDVSDLTSDPLIMFQHKYYLPLSFTLIYIIPIFVCCHFWGESLLISICAATFKNLLGVEFGMLVNSFAHIWGYKPYDKNVGGMDNRIISIFAIGEGWHNYHHVFPWDYKASEFGTYGFNWTTGFIDFFAWIGWAYDLKTVSKSLIEKRAGRTGDGSWNLLKDLDMDHHHKNAKWGWGDKDISQEDLEITRTL